MEKQFREGMTYSGEMIYGCSGSMDTNCITVLKREGANIVYRENFGRTEGEPRVAPVQIVDDWGEYVTVGDDRFFAYALKTA